MSCITLFAFYVELSSWKFKKKKKNHSPSAILKGNSKQSLTQSTTSQRQQTLTYSWLGTSFSRTAHA